ncbi:MAG: FAD-binding protein [Aliishimia sp.]
MTPNTEAELAEMIKTAKGPLSVRGGGTRGMAPEGEALSTSGLSGVTLYEPGALTLVAQAGTPVAEIEAVLAQENQRLAFEPMDHRVLLGSDGVPTIGGVFAANVSGPRRVAAGAARDFALGVRYVDGSGNAIKNGGRVMKNVTGYDLVKLLCGSWGTLGVMSEVSLKVLPTPETQTSLVLDGLKPTQAVAAMSAALGSAFEVTGAAYMTRERRTVLRIDGFEASVAYRAGQLQTHLRNFGDVAVLQADQSASVWQDVRDVRAFAQEAGDVWRVSVKPSDGPAVLEQAQALDAVMDWGGGLVWLRAEEGTDLRARLSKIAGHATLVRASAITRSSLGTFEPERSGVATLSAGLRARFDPRGILNPGLMTV